MLNCAVLGTFVLGSYRFEVNGAYMDLGSRNVHRLCPMSIAERCFHSSSPRRGTLAAGWAAAERRERKIKGFRLMTRYDPFCSITKRVPGK